MVKCADDFLEIDAASSQGTKIPAAFRLAAPGGHYSHAVAANGFVFVSSQLSIAFVTQA